MFKLNLHRLCLSAIRFDTFANCTFRLKHFNLNVSIWPRAVLWGIFRILSRAWAILYGLRFVRSRSLFAFTSDTKKNIYFRRRQNPSLLLHVDHFLSCVSLFLYVRPVCLWKFVYFRPQRAEIRVKFYAILNLRHAVYEHFVCILKLKFTLTSQLTVVTIGELFSTVKLYDIGLLHFSTTLRIVKYYNIF